MNIKILALTFLGLGLGLGLTTTGCAPADTSDEVQPDPNEEQGEDGKGDGISLLHRGTVDQVGIVEATTMQLAALPISFILDQYNREDPFNIQSGTYLDTFENRLYQFDDYDAEPDWMPEQARIWNERMSSGNYLVVDTSAPCDYANPHTYLEIERSQLNGLDSETCGGRMPNEDAMDVTLNFLVRGPAASAMDLTALHDGVEQATKKSTDSFPYLAEMN